MANVQAACTSSSSTQSSLPASTDTNADHSGTVGSVTTGSMNTFFKVVECGSVAHGIKPKTPPTQRSTASATISKTTHVDDHRHHFSGSALQSQQACTSSSSGRVGHGASITAERQTRAAAAHESSCLASPPPPPVVTQRAVGSRSGSASSVSSASMKQQSPSCLRSGGSPVSPGAVGSSSRPCSNSSASSSNGAGRGVHGGNPKRMVVASYVAKHCPTGSASSNNSSAVVCGSTTKARSIVAPPPRHLRPSHRAVQQRDAGSCMGHTNAAIASSCAPVSPRPLQTAQEEIVDVAWAHDLPSSVRTTGRPTPVALGGQPLQRSAPSATRRQIDPSSSSSDDDDDSDDGVAEQEAAPRLVYDEGDAFWTANAHTGSNALHPPGAPSCFDGAAANRPTAPTFPARYRRSVQSYRKQNQTLTASSLYRGGAHRFDSDDSCSGSNDD